MFVDVCGFDGDFNDIFKNHCVSSYGLSMLAMISTLINQKQNNLPSTTGITPASQAAVRGAVFAALSLRKIRDAYGSPSACDC